jgi:hypothetical protein
MAACKVCDLSHIIKGTTKMKKFKLGKLNTKSAFSDMKKGAIGGVAVILIDEGLRQVEKMANLSQPVPAEVALIVPPLVSLAIGAFLKPKGLVADAITGINTISAYRIVDYAYGKVRGIAGYPDVAVGRYPFSPGVGAYPFSPEGVSGYPDTSVVGGAKRVVPNATA